MQTATGGSTYRINTDSQLQLSPFNFIRSGYYYYSDGNIITRNDNGYYLGSNPDAVTTHTKSLVFSAASLSPQNANYRSNGMTLRCLVR